MSESDQFRQYAEGPLSLLKNELSAIWWDKRNLAASPISRGSTLIAMMQTADLGEGNNVAPPREVARNEAVGSPLLSERCVLAS